MFSDTKISKGKWPNKFEDFGVVYLKKLKSQDDKLENLQGINDRELVRQVRWVTFFDIALSAIVGTALAFCSVYTDLYFENSSPLTHYGLVAAVTTVATLIEIYILLLISLHTVYKVAELCNVEFSTDEKAQSEFPFSIEKILSRTALELSDPRQDVLGIDAFKKVPGYKLVLIGIVYKLKVMISNVLLRSILKKMFGRSLLRVSVSYIALPVTALWNSVVLYRVAREARLRVFGYVLSNHISNKIINQEFIDKLSHEAKVGCIRAIANAVVLTQNYHPNMIILLLRFKDLLKIDRPDRFDDWELFIKTLNNVSENERCVILDILTISAAFDGRVTKLEKTYLVEAYKEHYDLYFRRLVKLTRLLRAGRLKQATSLCKIDNVIG
jgi:hypothetical protein